MVAWFLGVWVSLPLVAQAGFDWSEGRMLSPGITHARVRVVDPRPTTLNVLRIDTTEPGLRFYTTPRCEDWVEDDTETRRKTTREFIRQSQETDHSLVVAINADAFSPWPAPWNQETLTNVLGLAVSEGVPVSLGSGTPSLIVDQDGTLRMAPTSPATDLTGIRTAVSGFGFCLTDGKPTGGTGGEHPRTGTGLSQDARYVYFLTIDGRRRSHQGATVEEVGLWLKYFGAYTGINMDGGGSTTMAWWNPDNPGPDKCELLNLPVGDGRDRRSLPAGSEESPQQPYERCNGSNIGIYYLPSTND